MLELSVEFFPPKTGEGISRFKEAAKELSLMRFGIKRGILSPKNGGRNI